MPQRSARVMGSSRTHANPSGCLVARGAARTPLRSFAASREHGVRAATLLPQRGERERQAGVERGCSDEECLRRAERRLERDRRGDSSTIAAAAAATVSAPSCPRGTAHALVRRPRSALALRVAIERRLAPCAATDAQRGAAAAARPGCGGRPQGRQRSSRAGKQQQQQQPRTSLSHPCACFRSRLYRGRACSRRRRRLVHNSPLALVVRRPIGTPRDPRITTRWHNCRHVKTSPDCPHKRPHGVCRSSHLQEVAACGDKEE